MRKGILQIVILLNIIVILAGCSVPTQTTQTGMTESFVTPEIIVTATIEEPSETPEATATTVPATTVPDPAANCPTPGAGSKLFVDRQNGFCLLYPDNFEQSAYKEYSYDRVQFTEPGSAPNAMESVSIHLVVESNGSAKGQNSTQYAQRWIANFAVSPEIDMEDFMLNGLQAASLVLPAEAGPMTRHIFLTANDIKYHITLSPQLGTAPELEPNLQAAWDMATGSIVFFPPQSDWQYTAPEDVCPQPTTGSKQYISLTGGYCLLYPSDFAPVANFPGQFTGGPILDENTDWGDLRASLTVGTAGSFADQTVMDVLETRKEFIDVPSIQETTMAGYPAVVFIDPRGPWASRQAMIMVNGFVYTLVNQPWEAERYPDGMSYVNNIWDSVTSSLAFFDPWR